MWDKLKKNKFAVKIYEFVFTPIHHIEYKISLALPSFEKCHYSYGKLNKDKIFYIIKFNNSNAGVFSMVFGVIHRIEYALRKNSKYIPIIDCRGTFGFPNMQSMENAGKQNVWDNYFEQPKGYYSFDEVYQSKHVVYERKKTPGVKKIITYRSMPMPEKELYFWSDLFNRYIRPKAGLKERIECESTALLSDKKILGVSIRAGFRAGGMLKLPLFCHHPRGMSCDMVITEIARVMDEWGYDYFFLACDDREYSDRIAAYYADRCIRMNRRLAHYFENDEPVPSEMRLVEFEDYTMQKRTEDYIVECYVLSKCDSLYTDGGSGAEFAYITNRGKYKHFEIYKSGFWTEEEFSGESGT